MTWAIWWWLPRVCISAANAPIHSLRFSARTNRNGKPIAVAPNDTYTGMIAMNHSRRRFVRALLASGVLLALPAASLTQAATKAAKSPLVTVRVDNMHCGACAQKIARKLYAVPGVVKVKTDLASHTAVITPEAGKNPSPKAIWEAVEKAGFKPVSLQSPGGNFQKKPTK